MRTGQSLFRDIFPSYVAVALISLAVTGVFALAVLKVYLDRKTAQTLEREAQLLVEIFGSRYGAEFAPQLQSWCRRLGLKTSRGITVLLPDGRVLADCTNSPEQIGPEHKRPEVRAALDGRVGTDVRHSFESKGDVMHVAVPVMKDGKLVGVVRTSTPTLGAAAAMGISAITVILVLLFAAATAAGGALIATHRLREPLERINEEMRRLGKGDLSHGISVSGPAELTALADGVNMAAARLDAQLSSETHRRNELEAVVSAMVEAILFVDHEERIMGMNKAAERLFEIDEESARGRIFQEAIRNSELHRFVRQTLASPEPIEADLVFMGDPDQYLQVHGTRVKGPKGKSMGALLVLNDVTRLKKLENIRKDFVASVSHELKTPITSIKGFLETLQEGALNDPENAERFLDIIMKHTDRLIMIIEDLLQLSRIEQEAERKGIELEDSEILPVIEAVYRTCVEKAAEKAVRLDYSCPEHLMAPINARLLEQAIFNLVDNAIKYSGADTEVSVTAEETNGKVTIKVSDQGCGIPKEHLSRIFERFYRVDKARSRKQGGTGLGLAITKHIVSAHNGRIEAISPPGGGAVFIIDLPRSKEQGRYASTAN